jgi:Cu+-exporting ATPase
LAAAIVAAAAARGIDVPNAEDFEALAGRGLAGRVAGQPVLLGTRELLADRRLDLAPLAARWDALEAQGNTVVGVSIADRARGLLAVADTLKESARPAVAALQQMGLRVALITGDNARTAAAIAREVGIRPDDVHAGVLPEGKAAVIARLQRAGPGSAPQRVAMVGDGINDAPALASADLGLALGTGTDVALESADVALMRADLRAVPAALRLGRATLRKVRQNLFWALAYNVLGIPVAALGWLDPIVAGAAMALSSVSVVTSASLLARFDPRNPSPARG